MSVSHRHRASPTPRRPGTQSPSSASCCTSGACGPFAILASCSWTVGPAAAVRHHPAVACVRNPSTSPPCAVPGGRQRASEIFRQLFVALDSTRCYIGAVSAHPEITQRDLRTRSREIMDAVEHGQSFTVTRDGHRIGELIPLRQRRRFVSRQEFIAMSRNAPAIDLEAFRADQDVAFDHEAGSPYER